MAEETATSIPNKKRKHESSTKDAPKEVAIVNLDDGNGCVVMKIPIQYLATGELEYLVEHPRGSLSVLSGCVEFHRIIQERLVRALGTDDPIKEIPSRGEKWVVDARNAYGEDGFRHTLVPGKEVAVFIGYYYY